MTTKSDKIRALAAQGMARADIARELGIRYQHVRNVLEQSGLSRPRPEKPAAVEKPVLTSDILQMSGFALSSHWLLSADGSLVLKTALPKESGVYAFAINGVVLYVGLASMGLSRRLYFYSKPAATQKTSLRLNEKMRTELASHSEIEIYTAFPHDHEWNGLPVDGNAGLELGLIRKYALPWNKRGTTSR